MRRGTPRRWAAMAMFLAAAPYAQPSGAAEAPRARLVRVDLEGSLVSALAARGDLWLLVGPKGEPDGSRRLLRLDPQTGDSPVEMARALPGWIKTLAALDLGSGPELLAGGLGEIDRLGPLAGPLHAPARLLADPDLDLRSLSPGLLRRGVEPWLPVGSVGRVRLLDAQDGKLRELYAAPLPVEMTKEDAGLRLTSPPGAVLERGADRLPLLVFAPEAKGRMRVRATILDPETPGDAGREEDWARLPAPEEIENHRVLRFDGKPFLVVRTQGSETVNAFEKQRLRVLPLRPDRTRGGVAASFAAELDTRRWHEASFASADLDGDGHDDLVVVRPEGFRGKDLVVESYPGLGDGRFRSSSRRLDLAGPFERFRLEPPSGPDGLPGLTTVAGRKLQWRSFRHGSGKPVGRRPDLEAELPAAPRTADSKQEGTAPRHPRHRGIERGFTILGRCALGSSGRLTVLALETARDGSQRLYLLPTASVRRSASIASP